MSVFQEYQYLTGEIAYQYLGKIYVTMRVERGRIFGVFKPPYNQNRYLIVINMPNWKRDKIKYHYGVKYSDQLDGKRLSGQLNVSSKGCPYMTWLSPVGKKRPSQYKVIYHP